MINNKKIKSIISIMIGIFIFLIYKDTFAASANISASTTSAYVGDNVTVTVNYYATTWNLILNGSINDTEVGYNPNAVDMSGSRSWQLNTSNPGTYTVYLSGDVAGINDSAETPVSGSVTITISPRPVIVNPPSNNQPQNSSTNNENYTSNNNQTEQTDKSKNNKLKELSSDYGKIVKIDDNHYTLQIPSNIEEITLKAIPEDSKSKVTGDGKHKIKVGSTTLEIVIISESGEENKISLIVTRKDSYSIEDLETVLSTTQEDELSFKIKEDDKLTINQLTSIKNSGKTVTFDYYENNNKLKYSWIIDGTKLENIEEMSTKVSFNSKYENEISKLLNSKDGLYLTFNNEKYPKGTKLRIYVGNKYKNNDKINIYFYDKDKNKLELITNSKVKAGYIEFNISKGSHYVLLKEESTKQEQKSNSAIPIIFFIMSFVVFVISVVIYKKKLRKKKEDNI